jgi:hypothetical protein
LPDGINAANYIGLVWTSGRISPLILSPGYLFLFMNYHPKSSESIPDILLDSDICCLIIRIYPGTEEPSAIYVDHIAEL